MRISAILGIFGILAIMFLLSGCSFKYFDPQWYKFKSLVKKESGDYIFNKTLYDEAEILREKNRSSYVFVKRENDMWVRVRPLLSNGYGLIVDIEESDIQTINTKINSFQKVKYYYIDSDNNKHIISYQKMFEYTYNGLWPAGDEGRGFRLETEKTESGYSRQNKFLLKDEKWQQIKK